MEKIIQLANEYNKIKENWFVVDDWGWEYLEYDEEKEPMLTYKSSGTTASGEDAEAIMISKSYWFIKWLVENDKIDFDEVADWMESWGSDNSCDVPNVLMNLAIKDDPIKYLISIIKRDV